MFFFLKFILWNFHAHTPCILIILTQNSVQPPFEHLLPNFMSFKNYYYHPLSPIGEAQMLHRDGATHQWQPIRDHNPHKVTFPFPEASSHQLPPAPWLRVGCWGSLCCPCRVFNWLDLMQVIAVAVRACVWRGPSEDSVPQHSCPLAGFYILLTLPSLMLLSLGMGGRFCSPVTIGHSQLHIFSILGGHESPHDLLPIAIWSLADQGWGQWKSMASM